MTRFQVGGRVGGRLDEFAVFALVNFQDRLPGAAVGVRVAGMNEIGAGAAFEDSVADTAMRPRLTHIAALDFIPCTLGLYAGRIEGAVGDDKLVDAAVDVLDEIGCSVGSSFDGDVVDNCSFAAESDLGRCSRRPSQIREPLQIPDARGGGGSQRRGARASP